MPAVERGAGESGRPHEASQRAARRTVKRDGGRGEAPEAPPPAPARRGDAGADTAGPTTATAATATAATLAAAAAAPAPAPAAFAISTRTPPPPRQPAFVSAASKIGVLKHAYPSHAHSAIVAALSDAGGDLDGARLLLEPCSRPKPSQEALEAALDADRGAWRALLCRDPDSSARGPRCEQRGQRVDAAAAERPSADAGGGACTVDAYFAANADDFRNEDADWLADTSAVGRLLSAVHEAARETATAGGAFLLDVGANAGDASAAMRRQWGPTARIHSFEAVTKYAELLRARFERDCETEVHQRAVEDQGGRVVQILGAPAWHSRNDEVRPTLFTGASVLNRGDGYGAVIDEVPTVQLDAFVAEQLPEGATIAFLKVDTEGTDYRVLLGLRASLRRRRVAAVLFENNPSMQAAAGDSLLKTARYLQEVGYRSYYVGSGALLGLTGLCESSDVFSDDATQNVFALPADSELERAVLRLYSASARSSADQPAAARRRAARTNTPGPAAATRRRLHSPPQPTTEAVQRQRAEGVVCATASNKAFKSQIPICRPLHTDARWGRPGRAQPCAGARGLKREKTRPTTRQAAGSGRQRPRRAAATGSAPPAG